MTISHITYTVLAGT